MQPGAVRRTVPTGAFFALITLLSVAASPFLLATGLLGSCLFQSRFAIPCPTCHTTRAFAALAQGDFLRALSTQPLMTGLSCILIVWGIGDFRRWRAGQEPPLAGLVSRNRATVSVLIPCAIAANWLYLASR